MVGEVWMKQCILGSPEPELLSEWLALIAGDSVLISSHSGISKHNR